MVRDDKWEVRSGCGEWKKLRGGERSEWLVCLLYTSGTMTDLRNKRKFAYFTSQELEQKLFERKVDNSEPL